VEESFQSLKSNVIVLKASLSLGYMSDINKAENREVGVIYAYHPAPTWFTLGGYKVYSNEKVTGGKRGELAIQFDEFCVLCIGVNPN
jgi:hypothetical protein